MNDAKKLQQERTNDLHSIYDNIIPKRVPVNVTLGLDVVCEYAGVDRKESLWNQTLLESAAEELCEKIPTDTCIYGGKIQIPGQFQTLGSRNYKMAENGFVQHPNTVGMLEEDYDSFIENPFDCLIENVIPRNNTELDFMNNPVRAMFALAETMLSNGIDFGALGGITSRLCEKYGYPVTEPGTGGYVYAPFDFLSDQLRSFSGILTDVRRRPEKVKEAVEALYPLNYKVGIPQKITKYNGPYFPLHMATYLREKDFANLWWPNFLRQITDYASLGLHSAIICEHDWMRYTDYLQDLPAATRIQFEYGDEKKVKDKLGSKFVISGIFPLGTVNHFSKQECIDKTKEHLDIMAPGGNFIFRFEKSPLVLADINIENLAAICETVRDYGIYDNAGQKAGLDFCKEDYTHSQFKPFESKYFRTWEEYLKINPQTPESAQNRVMSLEDRMIGFIYSLCL